MIDRINQRINESYFTFRSMLQIHGFIYEKIKWNGKRESKMEMERNEGKE